MWRWAASAGQESRSLPARTAPCRQTARAANLNPMREVSTVESLTWGEKLVLSCSSRTRRAASFMHCFAALQRPSA
eukprot:5959381-Pyramimonas_sp.AAC.1